MKFIADLHIHSHYSIATSKHLIPEYLDYWARLKGIDVVGTGDCVHPGWLSELKEKLDPLGNGLFTLKKELRIKEADFLNPSLRSKEVYFILTGEISSIYKREGRVRKVHNICVFPDFDSLENVQTKLLKIGNIQSDGRPILGLDSEHLLDMVLNSSDLSFLIPAHIWTPWFSVLGSKSGFDSLEECYGDLTKYIFAVETGLSSDPPMNRACSFLDQFRLVSNSDAHSPEKLGREANLFDTDSDIDYVSIFNALKENRGFTGTIEFFPQEGKYHYDGHRKCGILWDPLETAGNNGICSVCGKPVTKGVMYRVAELADKRVTKKDLAAYNFYSITSLSDLLSEITGRGPATKGVKKEYFRLVNTIGPELNLLLFEEIDRIKESGGEELAEGVGRLRRGDVYIKEGYDGEFGRITVFNEKELREISGTSLFNVSYDNKSNHVDRGSINFDIEEFRKTLENRARSITTDFERSGPVVLTDEQKAGIEFGEGQCMILAGPGSGKTRVLTERIVHLIKERSIPQEEILAITFSNKAAEEMKRRVDETLSPCKAVISTFHAFGLSVLKEHYSIFGRGEFFYIIDSNEISSIIEHIQGISKRETKRVIKEIDSFKQGITEGIPEFLSVYNERLRELNAFDLNDLVYCSVNLLKNNDDILSLYRNRYKWILIDEFQDINPIQYEMVRLMAGDKSPNLFVIGDPDQAIYGFRGAGPGLSGRFGADFPEMEEIHLKRSYRCPNFVLKAGSQVLKKGDILNGIPVDIKIEVKECESERTEAEFIASQIEKMIGGVRSFSMDSGVSDGTAYSGINGFSDFAVLCRTKAMFAPIIDSFKNHGIAYQVIGEEPFYKTEPFLSLIQGFKDAYRRFLNENNDNSRSTHSHDLKCFGEGESISSIIEKMAVEQGLSEKDCKRMNRISDVFVRDYPAFFRFIATGRGIDDFDFHAEAVSLMTMHASKGLEFNTVIVPGCEQGIIPFELFGKKSLEELGEEERLFYVSVTRTMKYLFLTRAKKRMFRGRALKLKKSEFLDRLEKKLLRVEAIKLPKNPKSNQLSLF